MPNGHGGYPFMGSPLLLAIALVSAFAFRPEHAGWLAMRPSICVALAALLGWRVAYHLHMRQADEYGGAYYSEAERSAALERYRILAAVYAAVCALLTAALLRFLA